MSIQTLDQRLASLLDLRKATDAEIRRVRKAIAADMAPRRKRGPYRSRTEIPPCGTDSAYHRHRHFGELIDDECRAAHNAYERERAADRRRQAGQKPWREAS